ncbi:MAG: hypothetical protein HC915_12160 [Anaerolineae bacterium]|nr:hypothetical protein [Anaerolineae bacterium]
MMLLVDREAFFDALRPHRARLRGVFFGHIHRAFTAYRDGILCSAAMSSFRQFFHYPGDPKPRFDYAAPGGYALVTMTHRETIVNHYTIPR